MARTKQTRRKSRGGLAPKKQLAKTVVWEKCWNAAPKRLGGAKKNERATRRIRFPHNILHTWTKPATIQSLPHKLLIDIVDNLDCVSKACLSLVNRKFASFGISAKIEIPDPTTAKEESLELMLKLRNWIPRTHVLCAGCYKYKVAESLVWCPPGWSVINVGNMFHEEQFEADEEDGENNSSTEGEDEPEYKNWLAEAGRLLYCPLHKELPKLSSIIAMFSGLEHVVND